MSAVLLLNRCCRNAAYAIKLNHCSNYAKPIKVDQTTFFLIKSITCGTAVKLKGKGDRYGESGQTGHVLRLSQQNGVRKTA